MESDCKKKDSYEEYFKKIQELQEYVNPLKERFLQLDDTNRLKVKKVEKLIDILSNTKNVKEMIRSESYERLLKYEKALVSKSGILALPLLYDQDIIATSKGKVILSKRKMSSCKTQCYFHSQVLFLINALFSFYFSQH